MAKALVLLSGGLDSATCLYWARSRFAKVHAITFNYHGRLAKEKHATARLAEKAGVSGLIEIDLPFVKETSDFFRGKFASGSEQRLSSYVPARNMIFYSIAAHYAEFLGVNSIIGGHNLDDGQFFKDATRGYTSKLNALFREGCLLCNGRAYRIVLPLAQMKRVEIIRLALKLKTPIGLTWSCHKGGTSQCGSCYACKERIQAFSSLGMHDPAILD
jgi:7-cyano-7-deazaguanine synthase